MKRSSDAMIHVSVKTLEHNGYLYLIANEFNQPRECQCVDEDTFDYSLRVAAYYT